MELFKRHCHQLGKQDRWNRVLAKVNAYINLSSPLICIYWLPYDLLNVVKGYITCTPVVLNLRGATPVGLNDYWQTQTFTWWFTTVATLELWSNNAILWLGPAHHGELYWRVTASGRRRTTRVGRCPDPNKNSVWEESRQQNSAAWYMGCLQKVENQIARHKFSQVSL